MPIFIQIKDFITSIHIFKNLRSRMELGQSMSRNKLLEQFATRIILGYFKGEKNIEKCETLEKIKRDIKNYMMYFNHR